MINIISPNNYRELKHEEFNDPNEKAWKTF